MLPIKMLNGVTSFSITELKNGNIIVADYANGIKIYNEKLNLFQPYYLKANFSPD